MKKFSELMNKFIYILKKYKKLKIKKLLLKFLDKVTDFLLSDKISKIILFIVLEYLNIFHFSVYFTKYVVAPLSENGFYFNTSLLDVYIVNVIGVTVIILLTEFVLHKVCAIENS